MEDFRKGKVGAALGEQSWATKSNEVNPFRLMDPAKLPLNAGSSFQVWQKPDYFSHSDAHNAVASSSAAKSYPQFAINDTPSAQATYHDNQKIQHPTPQPAPKNPINVAGATSADLGHNVNANMDPKKLKRMMANRESANRSRLRRIQHVADLESKAENLEVQIASFHPQIAACTNQKKLLIIEQSSLKLKMANLKKEKILKEAEIKKNIAEVLKRMELQRKQHEQFQALARMPTWDDGQQLMFNSNSNYSGLEQMDHTNSDQGAKNGEETSKVEVDTLSNQHEMLHGWETGQRLTTNSGLKISDHNEQENWNTSQVHGMMNQMLNNIALDSNLYSQFK